MNDTRSALQPGDLLANKYRVERVLGQGGMGVVVAATHVVTHDRVAVKFLLPEAARTPEIVQRFVNEARAAVQIKSEHVARVVDVDMLPSGAPYMVMEHLEGRDLSQLIEQGGPLPVGTAVEYVLQACEALAEAHTLGIVHRDLKPSNLFLTHRRDGSTLVKVLDFGISKLSQPAGQGGAQLTRTRGVMGSPLYMSPEQLTTPRDVDARADVWSLGVVLFELLTAAWPFNAETMEGLIVEVVTRPPASVRQHRPDCPEGLAAVVQRCLIKTPSERVASVAELASALAPFAPTSAQLSVDRISRVLAARASMPSAVPAGTIEPQMMRPSTPSAAGSSTPPGWSQTQVGRPQLRQRRLTLAAGAAGAAVLLLVGTTVALKSRFDAASPENAPASALPASPPVSASSLPAPPAASGPTVTLAALPDADSAEVPPPHAPPGKPTPPGHLPSKPTSAPVPSPTRPPTPPPKPTVSPGTGPIDHGGK
jgi:eukaryotic-like serine/threonine-protein kinase